MDRYTVQLVTVDQQYVQAIADSLCTRHDRMCTGDIGPDDAGNLWMVDGTDRLFVSTATGAATLIDAEAWLAEDETQPDLPDPEVGGALAVARWHERSAVA